MYRTTRQRPVFVVALSALIGCGSTLAQESINTDLDKCVSKERVATTAKGAALGAFAGLGKALLGKEGRKDDDIAKSVIVGAATGGSIGLLTSYYTSVNKCFNKNPSWVPESKLARSKTFEQAKAELNYSPEMGTVARTKAVSMPKTVSPGGTLEILSTFQVMTADGGEAPVSIERRLYAIADGKETLLPFAGKGIEDRTVEAGEFTSVDRIPVPADVAPGTAFRVEYAVSAEKKLASNASAVVTVR